MKTTTRIAALALALASTFAAGCAVDGTANDVEENLGSTESALSGTTIGDIGQGYDSVNKTMKANVCLTASDRVEGGSEEGNVDMELQSDRTQIARSLGLEVEASYGVYSAAASFYRSTESDSRSVSFIYGHTIDFKQIQRGANYEIAPMAAKISDPVEWTKMCGDGYVNSITRGARLYTALKFSFNSSTEKESFAAQFKAKGVVQLSGAISEAQKISKQNVVVSISAVQVGGDPTALSRILNDTKAKDCALDSASACGDFLTGIINYAGTTFPNQFNDASGRRLEGQALNAKTATTGYGYAPWNGNVTVPNVPELNKLNAPATKLLTQYQIQFAKQSRIQNIQFMDYIPNVRTRSMADKQAPFLNDAFVVTQGNVDALGTAWKKCFPKEQPDCGKEIAIAMAAQKPVSSEVLTPWFDAQRPVVGGLVDAKQLPFDLVDFRADGRHKDYCTVYGTTVYCQLGLGSGSAGGFEEKPSVTFNHGDRDIAFKPYGWMKLRSNVVSDDLALCAPTQTSGSTIDCIAIVKGEAAGKIRIYNEAPGKYTVVPAATTIKNPAGIDPAKLYEGTVKIVDDRAEGWWKRPW